MMTTAETTTTPFVLTVTEDRMQVLLSCPGAVAKAAGFLEDVQKELVRRGIVAAREQEVLQQALSQAGEMTGDVVDMIVARGRPPQPPQDGRLEWTANFFGAGYAVDPETKRIDFHQKTEDRAVNQGQLLVRVHPPQEGQDGADVYGVPIRVPGAKAAAIQAGSHVIWDEKERGYCARCNGRVRVVGRLLDIDNVYHIAGDVGNTTGNIKHNGQLIIDGDIEPDFKVECTGDIDVHGLIYAADIDCGGTLVARRGINQSLSKRIRTSGDLVAKYIHNGAIESSGSVHVETEIFQSQIIAAGEVTCTAGRIVGGEILAGGDITVGDVGSRGNVKTLLVAGRNCELAGRLQANAGAINSLKETLRALTPVYKQAMANQAALTAAQKEATMEMGFNISEAADGIAEMERQNRDLRQEVNSGGGARIRIMGVMHPGAVFRIFDAEYVVDDILAGPQVAVRHPSTGNVTLAPESDDTREDQHES